MTGPGRSEDPVRHRIRVVGVVQGVGFRPFVQRLANELSLVGHVGNDTEGVLVEVEGMTPVVERFEARLVDEAPPLARIDGVEAIPVDALGESQFRIVESYAIGPVKTFVSPDVAVCVDCLAELLDVADRRYRYPFINCTNCGPRFTITVRLPYDRPNTTMSGFPMCGVCAEEYHNPLDRRFHAQPVACDTCGPRIWFEGRQDERDERVDPAGVGGTDAAIAATQRALARGEIVAIKGLGGYHLACDATSGPAVDELRRRKARQDKPFAVMVRDLTVAEFLASIDSDEAALLTCRQRPIVLLRRRQNNPLAPQVAPGNPYIGILLPYTPVHHLLFAEVPGSSAPVPRFLVMTSGNLSEEPICFEDDDARSRLGRIADAWLLHDRSIHVPCDDSVVQVEGGRELPVRRSRGYAPMPLRLPFETVPVLAVGGELKNAFCLASGHDAWMSQHIGDMGSLETLAAFERSARQFGDMYDICPAVVAADAHPGYQTRRWAEERSGHPVALVQHHHAHIAAVMVEHGVPVEDEVIGYAFDGTGYGTDGAIWGGELLVAGYRGFERRAHLRYVPLPGGDATIRKPYRVALSHLWAAGIDWSPDLAPVGAASTDELAVLERQLERGIQCIPTSSMGRLFDAVSSLLGIRHSVSYEAQAAIELEIAACSGLGAAPIYRFEIEGSEIDPGSLPRSIIGDVRAGRPIESIAAGFHEAVAQLVADTAVGVRSETGIDRVALSGGVFRNVLLVGLIRSQLAECGFRVITHQMVPPNDGGLALGQMAVAGLCGLLAAEP
ncbi:MAG: carbamoyltransferase HypF [Acidimicrobiales bacterium]